MKNLLLTTALLTTIQLFGQSICTSNIDDNDVHTISINKCRIRKSNRRRAYIKPQPIKVNMKVNNNITKIVQLIEKPIAFENVDVIPLFSNSNSTKYTFSTEMDAHINSYLKRVSVDDLNNLVGVVRTNFIINKYGKVDSINVTCDTNNKKLINIMLQITSKLPIFVPGKHNGNTVNVSYRFKIEFN